MAKKPSSQKKNKSTKKTKSTKSKMPLTLGIKSKTHMFSRLGLKTIVYITGAGTIGSTGSPSTDSQFTLSSVSADSLTGCYQFGFSHAFSLINCIQYNEFTALFDRYKIVGIKYKLMYQCNDAQVSGLQVLPIITYAHDLDDNAVPSVYTDVASKSLSKTRVMGNTQVIVTYIKPKIAGQLYQSAISTGYSVEKSQYINTAYPSVPHYGIKFWLNNVYMSGSNNTAFTIQPEYILAMKDVQ